MITVEAVYMEGACAFVDGADTAAWTEKLTVLSVPSVWIEFGFPLHGDTLPQVLLNQRLNC